MGREKGDICPVILKIGLALAFSVGGMLCTFIRNKRIKPAQSPSDPSKSSDCGSKSKHHASSGTPNSCQFDPLARDKHNSLSDKDSYLLPEFNDLVKEFDVTSIKKKLELPISNTNPPPKVNLLVKTDSQEQEIKNLKNMVKMLKERERNLEDQLLEYYGLKEQETAVMGLQNRLKLNNMEAKLFALKIESLETDNKRLESQMADYNKVLTDLEAAGAKIKALKKRLISEAAQNKERILDLQQRVEKMQEDEHNRSVRIDPEIELKLCKLKDLEIKVNELRKSNYNLQVEKAELTQRLEHVQILAASVLEYQETEKLKKESEHLKKQNKELTKEIEQLQADRCSDVEELVYMRWVNACLRYELRHYQPGPELDSDQWSSPPSSNPMDSGELDDPFIDYPSSRKGNYKFFGKFVKFLRGKDGNNPDQHHPRRHVHDYNRHHSQCSHSRNSSFEQMESIGEDMNSYSDLGLHKRIDSIAEGRDVDDGFLGSPSSSYGQKSELVKYAEVLQDSNPKPPTRYHRRSTMFSSF
ncbi:hypothetical protein L1987_87844 [Smallanthus sonchifolius]|nr:hypothetical protein L1987_87844 [Smallanthus sonchifolius]